MTVDEISNWFFSRTCNATAIMAAAIANPMAAANQRALELFVIRFSTACSD